jgi:ketosteroid isomerase-like protein
MKSFRYLTALFALLSCVSLACAQKGAASEPAAAADRPAASAAGPADLAQIRKEIEELNRRMVETFKSGNVEGVAEFYTDDASIFYPRGKQLRGRYGVRGYWQNIEGGKDWKLEVLEVGGGEETIYEIGKSTFTSVVKGVESTYICNFVMIWKRQPGGGYKIYVDIYN